MFTFDYYTCLRDTETTFCSLGWLKYTRDSVTKLCFYFPFNRILVFIVTTHRVRWVALGYLVIKREINKTIQRGDSLVIKVESYWFPLWESEKGKRDTKDKNTNKLNWSVSKLISILYWAIYFVSFFFPWMLKEK